MEQAETSTEQAEAADKDKVDADLEDAEEWFTLERLETFALHLQRHPILWRSVHCIQFAKRSRRGLAYTRLMDSLEELRAAKEEQRQERARVLCQTYFKMLRQKLRWAAAEALARGGGGALALALLPAWARRAELYLHLLPGYLKDKSSTAAQAKKAKTTENASTKYAATDTAAGRRLLRRIVRGMRRAARAQRGLTRAAAAAVARRLRDSEEHVYSLWCSMRSLAMAKLRTLVSRGDVPPMNPSARMSARDWAVADLLLQYDCALISDSNFQQYDQLRALLATFHLVQRFKLEPEPEQQQRVPPQTWTAAARWYSRNRVVMSAVALQKRWHELAQDTRWRLRAHLRGDGAQLPVVLPLHQAVARRYPHIVTATSFEPWRKLLSSGKVAAPTSPRGPAPGDPISARLAPDTGSDTDSDTAGPEEDDDLIIIEKNIETIDLSEDEGASERVQPKIVKRSQSNDMPTIDSDSGEDINRNDDDRLTNTSTHTSSASVDASKNNTNNSKTGSDNTSDLNKETTEETCGESKNALIKNAILSPKTVFRNWFEKTAVVNKDTGKKSNNVPDKSINGTNNSSGGSDKTLDLNTKINKNSNKVTNRDKKVSKNSFNKNIDFGKEIIDADAASPQEDVLDALQELNTGDVETMVLFDSEEDDTNIEKDIDTCHKSKKQKTRLENSLIQSVDNAKQPQSSSRNASQLIENHESHNSIYSQAQERLERKSSDSSEGNLVIDHNYEIEYDHGSSSNNVTDVNTQDANVKTSKKEKLHDRDKPSFSKESNFAENCKNSNEDITERNNESDDSSNKNTLLQKMLISDEVEQLNSLKVDVRKVAKVYENKKKYFAAKRYNRETVSVKDLINAVRNQEHSTDIVIEGDNIDESINADADMNHPDISNNVDVVPTTATQKGDIDTEDDDEVGFDPKLLMVPIVPLKRIDDEIDLRTKVTAPSFLSLHRSESPHGSVSSRRSVTSRGSVSPSGSIPSRRSTTSRRPVSPSGTVSSRRSVTTRRSVSSRRSISSRRPVSPSSTVSSRRSVTTRRSVSSRRSISSRRPVSPSGSVTSRRSVSPGSSISSRRSVTTRRSVSSRRSISSRPSPAPGRWQRDQKFLDKNKELLKKCKPCSVILTRVEPGSYCGSEKGGSRVTKKVKRVELPNIEEVRRNNKSMLTAQVAPLSLRHDSQDSGSTTEAASSEEEWTPDADELPLVNSDSRSSGMSGDSGGGVDTSAAAPASSTHAEPLTTRPERLSPTTTNLKRLLDYLGGATNGEKCDHNPPDRLSSCARCCARLLAAPPAGAAEAKLQRRLLRQHSVVAQKEKPKVKKPVKRKPRASPPPPAAAPSPSPPPPPDPERDAREWLRQKNIAAEKFGVKPRCLKRGAPPPPSAVVPPPPAVPPPPSAVVPPPPAVPPPPSAVAPPPSLLPAASALYGEPARCDAGRRVVVAAASGAPTVLPLTEENLAPHARPLPPAPNIFNPNAVADINKRLGALVEEPPRPEASEGDFDPIITCVQSLAPVRVGPAPAAPASATFTYKNQAAASNQSRVCGPESDFVQKYVIIPSQTNKSQTSLSRPAGDRMPQNVPASTQSDVSPTIQIHMSPTSRDPTLPRVVDVTGGVQSKRASGLHLVVSQNAPQNVPATDPSPHIVVSGSVIRPGAVIDNNIKTPNAQPVNTLQVNSVQAGPSQTNTYVFTSMAGSHPSQFVLGTSQPSLVVSPMANTLVLSPMVQSQNNLVFGAVQQPVPMVVRSVQSGPSLKVTPQENPVLVNTVAVDTPAVPTVEALAPSGRNEVKSLEKVFPVNPAQDKSKGIAKETPNILNLNGAGPPVPSHVWVHGRDPTKLSVLVTGRTCWLLLQQFLVVSEQAKPPDQGTVFSISPRVRLILSRDETDDTSTKRPATAPKPDDAKPSEVAQPARLRVKSFARLVEPGAAAAASFTAAAAASFAAAAADDEAALVAPPRVFLNDRVYEKLSSDPLVYAKLIVAVPDARAGRELLMRGAALQLYCVHSCRLFPLQAEPRDDVSRITLSGNEEVSAALVSMARQLYQLPESQGRGTKRPRRPSESGGALATLEKLPAADAEDSGEDDTARSAARPAYKRPRGSPAPPPPRPRAAARPRVLNHVVADGDKPDAPSAHTYHLLLSSPPRAPVPPLAPRGPPRRPAPAPAPAPSKPPAAARKAAGSSQVPALKFRLIAPASAPAKPSAPAAASASASSVIDLLSSDEE